MRPDRLAPWVILLAVAVVADLTASIWIEPVARVVKGRHGWFDDPVPLEPDRQATGVGQPVAIGPDGTHYNITGAVMQWALAASSRDGAPVASWDVGTPQPLILPHPTRRSVFAANGKRLHEFDLNTGSARWTVITNERPEQVDSQFGDGWSWRIRSLVVNSQGELCAGGKLVRCFDADGGVRWTSKEDVGDQIVAGPDGTLFATSFDTVSVLDSSGSIVSRVKNARAKVFDAERNVLYAAWDGSVVAIAAAGKELWRVKTGPAGPYHAGPFGIAVGADGTVFASTGGLVALSPAGDEHWRFRPRDHLTSPPVIDENGDVLVAGRRRLFAVRPDGIVRWRATTLDELVRKEMTVFAVRPEGVYARGYPSMLIPRPSPSVSP